MIPFSERVQSLPLSPELENSLNAASSFAPFNGLQDQEHLSTFPFVIQPSLISDPIATLLLSGVSVKFTLPVGNNAKVVGKASCKIPLGANLTPHVQSPSSS